MPGAERLRDSVPLQELILSQHHCKHGLAAICAAPAVVLQNIGALQGIPATCHPGFMIHLDPDTRFEARVVKSGHIITSRGPGTALEFALELVSYLFGSDAAQNVADPMIIPQSKL